MWKNTVKFVKNYSRNQHRAALRNGLKNESSVVISVIRNLYHQIKNGKRNYLKHIKAYLAFGQARKDQISLERKPISGRVKMSAIQDFISGLLKISVNPKSVKSAVEQIFLGMNGPILVASIREIYQTGLGFVSLAITNMMILAIRFGFKDASSNLTSKTIIAKYNDA